MITPVDIIEAIQVRIKEESQTNSLLYQLKQVHIDLLPKGFERPCVLVEYITNITTDGNKQLVHVIEFLTLTVFADRDKHGNVNTKDVLELQNAVSSLFRCGYLPVKDRNLHITSSNGGRDWDKAYIDVQLEFFDRRLEHADETEDKMGNLHTRVIYKTNGKRG